MRSTHHVARGCKGIPSVAHLLERQFCLRFLGPRVVARQMELHHAGHRRAGGDRDRTCQKCISPWFREDKGMCALVEQLAKYMEEHILSTQAHQGRFCQEWILGRGFQDGAPELQNRRSEATK